MSTTHLARAPQVKALLAAVMLILPSHAVAGGLIEGIVGTESLAGSVALRRAGISLREPADMAPANPVLTTVFSAENLLRKKVNGILTSDLGTSGRATSLFVPLRFLAHTTVLAVTSASSSADLYDDNPKTGYRLSWGLDSSAWAIAQTLGSVRLGMTSSRFSGRAYGTLAYPRQAFKLFADWPDARIAADGSEAVYQASLPLFRGARLRASRGTSSSHYSIDLSGSGSTISIPVGVNAVLRRVAVDFDIGSSASLSVEQARSSGDGADHIYAGSTEAGRTHTRTAYSDFDASLTLGRARPTQWLLGYVSTGRKLNLDGYGVRGKKLGISIQPFNDKIDFNARFSFLTNFAYLGAERRLSDRWRVAAYYKRIRTRSRLDADYIARGFFGLVSVSGDYATTFFDERLHGLQLSATYTAKRVSIAAAIEQLIPSGHGGERSSGGPSTPKVDTTGGTSLSLTCAYGL